MGNAATAFLVKWTNGGGLKLKTHKDGRVSLVEYLVRYGVSIQTSM